MAKAIRKGLADGSISPEVDVREIYYNSYDAILGIMQRLSIGGSPSASALDYDSRDAPPEPDVRARTQWQITTYTADPERSGFVYTRLCQRG